MLQNMYDNEFFRRIFLKDMGIVVAVAFCDVTWCTVQVLLHPNANACTVQTRDKV